jgi:hypothetical protein
LRHEVNPSIEELQMKRRYWREGFLAAASIVVGSLVARAYDTTWISTGQLVSATKLKADLDEAQTRIAALEVPKYRFQGGSTVAQTMASASDGAFVDVNITAATPTQAFVSFDNGAPADAAQLLLAGVQVTPPRSGTYRVTCQFSNSNSGGAVGIWWRLSDGNADGATPIHNSPGWQWYSNPSSGTVGLVSPVNLSWDFALTGGTPVTLRLQIERQGSGVIVGGPPGAIIWQIEEL